MRQKIKHIPLGIVQEFDILNKSASGLLPSLIKGDGTAHTKLLTGSQWSHTAVAIKDPSGQLWWYEALSDGFVKSPMRNYCDPLVTVNSDIVDLSLFRMTRYFNKTEKFIMRDRANSLLGRKYSWAKIFGAVIQLMFRLDHNPIKGSKITCTEAVAKIYRAAGIYLTPQSPRTTYPSHIPQSALLDTIV